MGDVLSQSEIDQLLNALSSGELDVEEMKDTKERPVKDYDFARPAKFSKEHLRTLEIIFEHYARLLSTELSVHLRKTVQIDVMNSEAVTYSEFTNALSNPVILGIVDASPLKESLILELASNIGYAIVDRMLGGPGVPLAKARDFSEIEITIVERIMSIAAELLKEPWQTVIEMKPKLGRIETNSQFAQFVAPTEMTAIVTMNIKLGDVEGLMNICIPFEAVKEVMDKLNTKYWYSNKQEDDENSYHESIERLISKSHIPIKAVLGKSTISVFDFAQLQLGDIIRLDTKVNDELNIYVGNIKKFTALPGASGDNYAVRVTSIFREEQ